MGQDRLSAASRAQAAALASRLKLEQHCQQSVLRCPFIPRMGSLGTLLHCPLISHRGTLGTLSGHAGVLRSDHTKSGKGQPVRESQPM
jgi:hypothetical protein